MIGVVQCNCFDIAKANFAQSAIFEGLGEGVKTGIKILKII